MDFLMLLPNSVRVVIEVDGKEHYVSAQGHADPAKYAAMVSADRDLRLAGYDVYRFGATDLSGDEDFGGQRFLREIAKTVQGEIRKYSSHTWFLRPPTE